MSEIRAQHRPDALQRLSVRAAVPAGGCQTGAKFKYDATKEQDAVIIQRVAEIAEKRGVA